MNHRLAPSSPLTPASAAVLPIARPPRIMGLADVALFMVTAGCSLQWTAVAAAAFAGRTTNFRKCSGDNHFNRCGSGGGRQKLYSPLERQAEADGRPIHSCELVRDPLKNLTFGQALTDEPEIGRLLRRRKLTF